MGSWITYVQSVSQTHSPSWTSLVTFVLATQIAQKFGPLWALKMFLVRCYKDSYFPPDVDKYTGYEKILKKKNGFGRLCSGNLLGFSWMILHDHLVIWRVKTNLWLAWLRRWITIELACVMTAEVGIWLKSSRYDEQGVLGSFRILFD